MNEIRAFIAIELPVEVGKTLEDARRILASRLTQGGIRWVKTSNIHLTLRFLGNVGGDVLPAIADGLDTVTARITPFSLDLNVLGCFPNPRRPRVVWIGLVGDSDQLNSLNHSIERMLIPLGWEAEGRKYHPHLTLGRVKDSKKVIEARLPWGDVLAEGRIDVQAIHLVESQLYPTGAVHTIRHSGYLSG